MNTTATGVLISGCLFASVFIGMGLRRVLPEGQLSADSRDAVKLAVGLVATMTALLLGLLVSSAKGTYDTERSEIIQMAAKLSLLNRVLALYGVETQPSRIQLRDSTANLVHRFWNTGSEPTLEDAAAEEKGNRVFEAIQSLTPNDDRQKMLKAQAMSVAMELAQLRTLLSAQSIPSVSTPLLVAVVCWLVVIFVIFSVLAPPNATTRMALLASALSVAGAVCLILELDQPFTGIVQIPSQPMVNVLSQFPK